MECLHTVDMANEVSEPPTHISKTFRVNVELNEMLKRTALERRLNYQKFDTETAIVNEALWEWLEKNGTTFLK